MKSIAPEEIYVFSYLINKTQRYLDLLEKKYKSLGSLGLYLVYDQVDFEDKKVDLIIIVRFYKNWVQTLAPVFPIDDLTIEEKLTVYELVLTINNELADTSFELDKDLELIMISNETHVDAFIFDVFEEEYNAILNAISVFLERGKSIFPNILERIDKGMKKWLDKYAEYLNVFEKREETFDFGEVT